MLQVLRAPVGPGQIWQRREGFTYLTLGSVPSSGDAWSCLLLESDLGELGDGRVVLLCPTVIGDGRIA